MLAAEPASLLPPKVAVEFAALPEAADAMAIGKATADNLPNGYQAR